MIFAKEQLTAQVEQFKIFVDGWEREFDMPIVTINDRTYVPLREISEKLGMNVEWDEGTQTVVITAE